MTIRVYSIIIVFIVNILTGCLTSTVDRRIDNQIVSGRYISENAYTFYALGIDAEAHEDWMSALSLYEKALSEDPESIEIQTRIFAVQCRIPPFLSPAYFSKFDHTIEQNPHYAPLYYERAICAWANHQPEQALTWVEKALFLEPEQSKWHRFRLSLLLELHRSEEAHFAEFSFPPLNSTTFPTYDKLYNAIVRDDRETARRIHHALHLNPSDLALAAIELGNVSFALDQARLELDANPENQTAWVALLILEQRGMTATPVLNYVSKRNISPLGQWMLSEMIGVTNIDSGNATHLPIPQLLTDPILTRVIKRRCDSKPMGATCSDFSAKK